MPLTKPTERRTVTIGRDVWNGVWLMLAANVIDDLRDSTGWAILTACALMARIVALAYFGRWLFAGNRDPQCPPKGGDVD